MRRPAVLPLLLLLLLLPACSACPSRPGSGEYRHVAVLGDPHLPGAYLQEKRRALATLGGWGDLDLLITVGDNCQDRGTDAEYAAVREFFAGFPVPVLAVPGNHDSCYTSGDPRARAGRAEQEMKLAGFRQVFGLPGTWSSRRVGAYLLVLLAADSQEHLAGMSGQQLRWLADELRANRGLPTIVFFHAPLEGTLRSYRPAINTPEYVAQPAGEIRRLLADNPQVFLWVSGHTHTPPSEESFVAPVNRYDGRVVTVHCTDLQRDELFTNSLFLYRDRVVVRTFGHREGRWLQELDRTVSPALSSFP